MYNVAKRMEHIESDYNWIEGRKNENDWAENQIRASTSLFSAHSSIVDVLK
jgi:hypothetical protein